MRGRVREGGIDRQDHRRLATTAIGLLLFFVVFALGGALVWLLTDVISRSDISGDGWSLRGNGALIVPVVLGPALLAAGWAMLAVWFRGQPRGLIAGALAGLATAVLAGIAGFAPVLAADWRVALPVLVLAMVAGLGLAALCGRPGPVALGVAATLLVLALLFGIRVGGSLSLVAPLVVPFQVAAPLLASRRRPDGTGAAPPGAAWQALGYIALPVAVVAGFTAANFLAAAVASPLP